MPAVLELSNRAISDTLEDGPHRWTREEYHRMIEAGVFDSARVELIEGEIWDMAPQKRPHFRTIRAVTEALEEAFGLDADVQQQGPVAFLDASEPEPDIAVVSGSWADYDDHPTAADVLLGVEISFSSLAKDRGPKLAAYARAGVEDYWIVNLVHHQLEVYRQPSSSGTYAESSVCRTGESVAFLNAPDKPIAVADLLPPFKTHSSNL